jgi:hypothetical protein
MNKDKALDLALEALELTWDSGMPHPNILQVGKTITAIKQARSAPVQQKPLFADIIAQHPGLAEELKAMDAAPVQEPVAWTDEQLQMLNFLYGSGEWDGLWFDQKHPTKKGAFWWRSDLRRLFTTPPGGRQSEDCLTAAQPAPVQEPVKTGDTLFQQFMSEADKAGITHLPTPPAAQRQWVSLTDEEVLEEEEFINHRYGKPINHTTAILMDFVKQIEDKLRSKNT